MLIIFIPVHLFTKSFIQPENANWNLHSESSHITVNNNDLNRIHQFSLYQGPFPPSNYHQQQTPLSYQLDCPSQLIKHLSIPPLKETVVCEWPASESSWLLSFFFSIVFYFIYFYFLFLFVVDFVIHWNETAMGLHVFTIPIPPPISLSTRSL